MLYIALGSNYDTILETKFGFIQRALELNKQIFIISVDQNPLPRTSFIVPDTITLIRCQYELNYKDQKNIQNFIQMYIPDLKPFEEIVIYDGIHFDIKGYIEVLTNELQQYNFKYIPIYGFRFISAIYHETQFDDQSIDNLEIFQFIEFTNQYKELLKLLFCNELQAKKTLTAFEKATLKNDEIGFKHIKTFISSTNLLKLGGKKLFRDYLNQYLTSKIQLDTITQFNPKPSFKPKPFF